MSLKEEDRQILVELESDYKCFFNVSEADIASKANQVSLFIEKVKQYIACDNGGLT